jgi:hypothetical protein
MLNDETINKTHSEHGDAEPPAEQAGREDWEWLHTECDVQPCRPLAVELCRAADRLAEIRVEIKKRGVVMSNGKKNPLLAEEARVQKQYVLI